MEVDSKSEANESEALLLGDGGDETEHTEFSSGDVELLLGDDDVNAFANDSFDAASSDGGNPKVETAGGGDFKTSSNSSTATNSANSKHEPGQQIEGHYNRGRGGRPYRGRGYGPPPPGYYPRGLRPPFPGAVPRFGRHPPPFALRGRPPMGYMRYPRGMYMRPPRPIPYSHREEPEEDPEEDVNMSKSEEDNSDGGASSGGGGGPKSLMSIKIDKDVKVNVKSQILSKAPQLMAPLGMGMGPRFHLRPGAKPPTEGDSQHPPRPGPRGMRPSVPSAGLLPTPPIHERLGERPHRGGGRGGHMEHHHTSRGPLKRSLSASHHEGPRAKMMVSSYSNNSAHGGRADVRDVHGGGSGVGGGGASRSNLRQIQTVDEPMQTAPPSHSMHHQHHRFPTTPASSQFRLDNRPGRQHDNAGRGGFVVSHKPAPSLTQIRTVDNSGPPPPSSGQRPAAAPAAANNGNSNLRSIPTLGGSNVPTPMMNPKITKTGGMSNRVMISNLPPMMSFERISAMTTAAGSVRNINVNDNATAIVEFANPASAENFIRTSNRKVIDRSMITVARLA